MLPLISVIIPAFNAADYISEAVESALNQTGVTQEIIVINDGSTDKTAEKLAQYNDSVTIISQSNQGLSRTRNTGIQLANGEFITFLDADDQFVPGRQSRLLREFETSPRPEVVVGCFQCFHTSSPTQFSPPKNGPLMHTAMVQKSTFTRTGPFNPDFAIGESVDWYLRAQHLGVVIKRVNWVNLNRREHDTNMTKTMSHSGYLNVIKDHLRRQREST